MQHAGGDGRVPSWLALLPTGHAVLSVHVVPSVHTVRAGLWLMVLRGARVGAGVDQVEGACCSGNSGCANGAAPTQCDIRCALVRLLDPLLSLLRAETSSCIMLQVYVPFWTECENMLSMVLGSGHRRQLRNGAGNGGDMQDWENLLETCDQIDSSQLLLAIKEYESHALVS